jgi:putative transposase
LQYLFTDGGKDLSISKLIRAIGKEFRFDCELREKPPEGGVIERLSKTINTQVLESLPGHQPNRATKEQIEKAEKDACLTLEDLDKILAGYFCDDYNHQPYPKDPRETRFERWFRGMGNQLPEPINERDLDICLMKEEQRTVQSSGSIYFEDITYYCHNHHAFRRRSTAQISLH